MGDQQRIYTWAILANFSEKPETKIVNDTIVCYVHNRWFNSVAELCYDLLFQQHPRLNYPGGRKFKLELRLIGMRVNRSSFDEDGTYGISKKSVNIHEQKWLEECIQNEEKHHEACETVPPHSDVSHQQENEQYNDNTQRQTA